MSATKNKAERRAMAFLERILARGRDGVALHCEGGCSREEPSLQWLLARGYMHIPLNRGTPPKWSRHFDGFFRLGRMGIHGRAPRQRAYVTEAGRQAYAEFPKPPLVHRIDRRLPPGVMPDPDYRFPENVTLLR